MHRRLRAGGGKGIVRIPAPEANAESRANHDRLRRITRANAKSKSEKFPPAHQDGSLALPLGSPHYMDPAFDPPDVTFSSKIFTYQKEPVQNLSGRLVDPATIVGLGHLSSKPLAKTQKVSEGLKV
ncbi:hypothetical protein IFM89_023525 [Coptis chinensis]|uniref:Uncharacterized protein n=1 Tax=Coptis chinensis TaxID=261450 RepID=A0A835LN80_9MAGN|nr:hypothetical protein IFM89_023525 [Coptis chinensis]